ncbi:hypothetical protein Taro_000808 [Colocasia esculenta]|uniref:Uncharacterized protein n=1 Tax=Colocasia esculenta TaxID=4460 RepID=A0A843TEA5_COLES|nr:hypothetical protein [Colocasia esculenta]
MCSASLNVERVAREAEAKAHERMKAEIAQLMACECWKAVAEYKKFDSHIEQITGLFRDSYKYCLKAMAKAFPELDLSNVQPLAADDDESKEEVGQTEVGQTDVGASTPAPTVDTSLAALVTEATTEL